MKFIYYLLNNSCCSPIHGHLQEFPREESWRIQLPELGALFNSIHPNWVNMTAHLSENRRLNASEYIFLQLGDAN